MKAATSLRIVSGRDHALTAAQTEQAIAVVCEAFCAKLTPYGVTKKAQRAILRESIDTVPACYALKDEVVVGVLGQTTQHDHFLRFRWRTLWRHLSPIRALIGVVVMCIDEPLAQGELRIEPLAVAADCRNHGIGSMLIQHVVVSAPKLGITLLALDVVDTNVAAERLYRRWGFHRVRTARTGWFTQRAGFAAIHRMHRHLDLAHLSNLEPKEA